MSTRSTFAAAAASLALGLVPAAALGATHPNNGRDASAPGHARTTTTSSTSTSSTTKSPTVTPSQAEKYGRLCQGQSKQHTSGTRGTPFSTCVRDMAQAAKSSKTSAQTICANESKKHTSGTKGTAFSKCVAAAHKLRSQQSTSTSGSGTSTTSGS